MIEYVEFGQQDTGVYVETVETDRGYGLDGQTFTFEESTSIIQLDAELDSDPVANWLLHADKVGGHFIPGVLRRIKTRAGVAAYVMQELKWLGKKEDAEVMQKQLYAA